MKDENIYLLKMISEGKSLNEISNALGLSNKQLFIKMSMLRNSGYLFDKIYKYNGDINYCMSNPFKEKINRINIETNNNLKQIRAVLISDTHLGNKLDNISCLNNMMEYCTKEGVNLVFHAGDFFEGLYKAQNQITYEEAKKQISYGLKTYPYDKNILTITVLGNHDATFLFELGIDIKSILEDRRHDIIPVGYGYGEVNIGSYKFGLQHPIEKNNVIVEPKKNKARMINLRGHSHKFKIIPSTNSILVYVPTLSNVSTSANPNPIPSMIDMRLKIENGQIRDEYFKYFVFVDNKPISVGEFQYYIPISEINSKQLQLYKNEELITNIGNNLQTSIEKEKNIAYYESQLSIENTNINYRGMNQIEKFNIRYSKQFQKTKK